MFTCDYLLENQQYSIPTFIPIAIGRIKQLLKIKKLWGKTENAVKTQIWIAVSTYLLVAIIKKKLNLNMRLYEILQILSVSVFDKTPLNQLLMRNNNHTDTHNQLSIFGL